MPDNRFLVVESDPDMSFLLKRQLEKEFPGCEVYCATSSREAVAALEPKVSAVITNQGSTDCDGMTLVANIRKGDADVPIITIGEEPQRTAAFRAGASAFVPASDWSSVGSQVSCALARN